MSDLYGKKILDIPALMLKMLLPVIALSLFTVLLLADFSKVQEKVANFFRGKEKGISTQAPEETKSKDIVVSKEDLEKAYKEVFKENRDTVEKNAFEAEEEIQLYYFIELDSGKMILATELAHEGESVKILDDKGYEILMPINSIVSIRKKVVEK